MTKHNIHKYVGKSGYNRIKHMRAMMKERTELTETHGEDPGNNMAPAGPTVSSFTIDGNDSPNVIEALRNEVAEIIGVAATTRTYGNVIVPFDGTEDARSITVPRPVHMPTSEERASLPA